jgi:non-heme chloroperoxidase
MLRLQSMSRRNLFIGMALGSLAPLARADERLRAPAAANDAHARRPAACIRTRDDVALGVRDWGSGKPVVLLAGWGLSADFWCHQFHGLLAAGHRCIALDRRGHGRSQDPGCGYDFDTLADDVGDLLEALDLRRVTLVGHSMASGEIVRYLSRHGSQRVARIAIIAGLTPGIARSANNPDGVPLEALVQARESIARDVPKWLMDNEPPFWTPDISPGYRAWARHQMLETSPPALIACHRIMTETDFTADLAAVNVPTLIVHGDRDASAPIGMTGERTARQIRGARFEVFAGAPHGLPVTHRHELNRLLAGFAA